jgi:hypothetical protein
LQSNTHSLVVPTSGGDLHWHRLSSLGESLALFKFLRLFDTQIPQAAQGISANQGALLDIFERMESVFRRFETYVKLPPTTEMTDMIVKVIVEVLLILSLVMKEINQGKLSKLSPLIDCRS